MILLQKYTSVGKAHKEQLFIILLSLTGVVIHLLFYNNLGFHRDELLYLSLGEHPDFGYFSVPPFIGFLAFLVVKIFGYSLFAVKIVPALLGGVMVYLAALTAKELKGTFFAQILAGTGLICSILFLRTFSLFQPVFLDVFFWTLAYYFLVRYINSGYSRYLYYFGVVIGFGILNKYNILFLVTALLIALPFSKLRKLFLARELYQTILIALLIALPNIVWQFSHQMPVLHHLGELRDSQLAKMSSATFLVEQLLMIFPATLIGLPGLFYLLFSEQLKRFRVIGFSMLIVLILYLLLQGKSYYSAGIYPLLVSAGAVFYDQHLKRNGLRVVLVLLVLMLTWLVLPMGISSKSPEKMVAYFDEMAKVTKNDAVRRYENNKYYPLPQDYADMLGWDELAAITNKAWQKVEHKGACLIYAENYGQAGAITILGKRYNLPEALSFSDNFRYWLPKTFEREMVELIYINHEMGADVKELFEDITEVGHLTNPLAREHGVKVFLCKKPKKSFNQFWASKVEELGL